jgi:hypothetical protein
MDAPLVTVTSAQPRGTNGLDWPQFAVQSDECLHVAEEMYNILIELGLPMKLVRLIKMCLNETCSKVRIGKYCLVDFLSKMD